MSMTPFKVFFKGTVLPCTSGHAPLDRNLLVKGKQCATVLRCPTYLWDESWTSICGMHSGGRVGRPSEDCITKMMEAGWTQDYDHAVDDANFLLSGVKE